MGDNTFKSHNKVGETMSFQTNSPNSTTFDPVVTFLSGSDRVSWDWGEGGGYTAGNTVFHTYPDSTTKTVTLRTNLLSRLKVFQAAADSLVGNLDMSGWDNLGGVFHVHINSGLTGITHTYSPQVFTIYNTNSCNLTGNHDVSMFPNLGGIFIINNNSDLTGITHTASSETFVYYYANNCKLTGNHDLPFPNLGGDFRIYSNSALTGITHTASPETFSFYSADNCKLTGNHDLPFPNLGGQFFIHNNSALTGITHTASPKTFTSYYALNCNLTGTLDLSMLTGLGGHFIINSNSVLTNIIFPITIETFNFIFLWDCDLGYINFLPLSGASMTDIRLGDNNMSIDEVNNILVDFDNISSSLNPAGWTGTTLDISGTNAAPDDGTGGGGDGLAALSSLTGVINNWTITTS